MATSPNTVHLTISMAILAFIVRVGTDLMVRAMQGLTADAPALKTLAGISARGRKLKKPYTHIVLSWPAGAEAPPKQG